MLAGFIAGFIWMAITVLAGGFSQGAIVGGGFAFLVGTVLVTAAITNFLRGAPAIECSSRLSWPTPWTISQLASIS